MSKNGNSQKFEALVALINGNLVDITPERLAAGYVYNDTASSQGRPEHLHEVEASLKQLVGAGAKFRVAGAYGCLFELRAAQGGGL